MTENIGTNKLPKIIPPSKDQILKAEIDHIKDIPEVKQLMDEGYGVLVNRDTGKVSIIEDKPKKKKKHE